MDILFNNILNEHISCLSSLSNNKYTLKSIEAAIHLMVKCFQNKGQVLFCGNGGSAADAEHLAGELSGRFKIEREPLNADAIHVNSAALTAISNDYDFETAYSRILEAKGKKNDILIAFSTSGKSQNILSAMQKAKALQMHVIAFCGEYSTEMSLHSNLCISVPSSNTPRIQEAHMMIGHYLCEKVENNLFS